MSQPAATAPALARTAPRIVPVQKLPDAMRSLWRAACPEAEGGDVARALVINFVGIAKASEEFALRAATDRLLRRSPCRAFLLLVDDSVRDVQAEVAVATRCSGNLRDIVLEEIVIRLPTSWFPHLPGLLRPLLMNDLPNHLYWTGGWPREPRAFDALLALCDHAIVDSRDFGLPAVELDALQARRQAHRITDLSWLRLRPWRRALAEAFQRVVWTPGTPMTGTIRHGRTAVASAILLAQWLEGRLGARIELEDAGVEVDTAPELVVLRTAAYDLQAEAKGTNLVVHVTTTDHCHLPFTVPASRGSDGNLLAAAIDLGGTDSAPAAR